MGAPLKSQFGVDAGALKCIECCVGLEGKSVAHMTGEVRVNRTNSSDEMVFSCVDCSFSSVGSVLVSWNKLAFHVGLRECVLEFL